MKPYKTSNKRIIHRDNKGRFRESTLADVGVPKELIQEDTAICADCGHKWMPILKTGKCPKCNSQSKIDEYGQPQKPPQDIEDRYGLNRFQIIHPRNKKYKLETP